MSSLYRHHPLHEEAELPASQVDVDDANAVRFWALLFDVEESRLVDLIKRVGTDVNVLEKVLRPQGSHRPA
jgi:hypothetical protein